VIVRDSVAGDDQPDAIVAAPAVHEDRPSLRVFEYAQHLRDLLVFGRPDPGETDADVPHARGFHLLSFPRHMEPAAAQIEHGLDAPPRQLRKPLLVWLLAAINVIVHTR